MKSKPFQQTKPNIPQSSDDHDEKYQEFLKLEKNIDIDAIKHNLNQSRFQLAVISGMFSGTLALTGLYGVIFYLLTFLVGSILISIYLTLNKGNFFMSKNTPLFHGLSNHVMV